MKKKKWTLQEIMTEVDRICKNPYARNSILMEFGALATTTKDGELVCDFGKDVDAYSIVTNLQARFLEHYIRRFMSEKGYAIENFWKDHLDEMHRHITGIFDGIYGGTGVRLKI